MANPLGYLANYLVGLTSAEELETGAGLHAVLDPSGQLVTFDDFGMDPTRSRTIDATALDMLQNTYLAAGDSAATLFQQSGGAAWQGGRDGTPGNGYMALSSPGVIQGIFCEWKYKEPAATESTLAVVITNDTAISGGGSLANLLHPIITRTTWTLQLRENGGTLNTLASGTFDPPLEADDKTVHRFAMIVVPEQNRVIMRLPGRDPALGRNWRSITTPGIGRALGRLAYWQVIRNPATDDQPGIIRIGTLCFSPSPRVELETVTATGAVNVAAKTTVIDATAGNVTLTLPAANYARGHEHVFVRKDATGNTVTVSGSFLDGATSKTIAAGASLRMHADSVNNVWVAY